MKVTAKLNNLRISPRKTRLAASLIKDCGVDEALFQLKNTVKRSNPCLEKLLNSAVANAENNFGLDRDNLYIYNIQIGGGPTLKRWMPRAHGRATTILKRTSNIKLVLEERVEGKNRKSKEQIKKEKIKRAKNAKKLKKEMAEGKKITEEKAESKNKKSEKVVAEHKKEHHEIESERKQSRESGWAKKIFRRKSG